MTRDEEYMASFYVRLKVITRSVLIGSGALAVGVLNAFVSADGLLQLILLDALRFSSIGFLIAVFAEVWLELTGPVSENEKFGDFPALLTITATLIALFLTLVPVVYAAVKLNTHIRPIIAQEIDPEALENYSNTYETQKVTPAE